MPTKNYQNNHLNFELSPATRDAWCKTRKHPTPYGSTQLPGLFGTYGFSADTNWVIMAFLIELAAVIITIWSGISRGFGQAIGATIIVALFIILDYVGIMLHNHQVGNKAIWRNQILVPQTPQQLAFLQAALKKRTIKEDVGVLFLFLSAFLKVFAIILLNAMFTNMIFILLFSLFYLIVIYIHAYHTGFWLAKYSFNSKQEADFKAWSSGNGNNAQIYVHNFQTPHSLQMAVGDVKRVNSQTLKCVSHANGLFSFRIECVGLMWDQDIATLCMGLLHAEKPVLAIECLQLQLTQIVASGATQSFNSQPQTSNSSGNAGSNSAAPAKN
jgi:hypothetical protein